MKKSICKRLEFLGVKLDDEKLNIKAENEPVLISADNSKVRVYITPVDEELMVAKNTYAFLERGAKAFGTGITILKPDYVASENYEGIKELAKAHIDVIKKL